MKKLISSVLIISLFTIISCGPSAEEKATAEQARIDSITAAVAAQTQKAIEDSLAIVQKAIEDSTNAARMQAMEDSLSKMKEAMNKPKPKAKQSTSSSSSQSQGGGTKTMEQMIKEAKEKQK